MNNLADIIINKLKSVDLSVCADAGVEALKEEMRNKVPQGGSPVKNGEWVNTYNAGYAKKVKKPLSPVNLDMGSRRYVNSFNKAMQDVSSVTYQYPVDYAKIAGSHQSGDYGSGNKKPRVLVPESKEKVPDVVLRAVKKKYIELF